MPSGPAELLADHAFLDAPRQRVEIGGSPRLAGLPISER